MDEPKFTHNPEAGSTRGATGLRPDQTFVLTDSCRIEIFPEPMQRLAQEIHNHPALVVRMCQAQDKDLYMQMAEIASYCGVVLDGFYSRADIVMLAELLAGKLYESRTGIVIAS